jgi:signal transduction histidine kinase
VTQYSSSIDKKLTLQVIVWSLLIGLLFSGAQVITDYRSETAEFVQDVEDLLVGRQATTALALYNYDTETLVAELASLLPYRAIVAANVAENTTDYHVHKGLGINELEQSPEVYLIFDIDLLEPDRYTDIPRVIGRLSVYADKREITVAQERRALFTLVIDLTRNIALAIVLVLVFRARLTGPIKRMTNNLLDVDIQQPGHVPLQVEESLEGTELDDLCSKMNALLVAMRSEMEQRIVAESKAKNLNEELEEKVRLRTHELNQTNQDLQTSLDQLKQMQDLLLQAQRMASMGQLAAGIAHEINNPVAVVYSNIATLGEYMSELIQLAEEYQHAEASISDVAVRNALEGMRNELDLQFVRDDAPELIAASKHSLERVRNIVNELRTFADADKLPKEDLNLAGVMDEVISDSGLNSLENIHVIAVMGELPLVRTVRPQVKMVLEKILQNAREAMPEGGVIEVAAELTDSAVELVIKDTGVGMEPEDVASAINPFFTRKEVGDGTGLGLTVAYNIMMHLGGELKIASQPGEGTMVLLKFPLSN